MGNFTDKTKGDKDEADRTSNGQMTDKKKKWEVDSPWELPKKRSPGGFDDHAPNGYGMSEEFGWTRGDTEEMYANAIRDLKARINVKREQRKKEEETKEKT